VSELLTKFEAAELLDHLHQSPDIWMQSEDVPGLWLHTPAEGGEGACALQFAESGPVFSVQALPLGWTAEASELYLQRLIEHWTTKNVRDALSGFLRDELAVEAGTAEVAAIALSQIEPQAPQGPCPDLPELEGTACRPDVGLFQFLGGGYASLEWKNGFLHVELSIPTRKQHLSFGSTLTGLLRGVCRSHAVLTERTAEALEEGTPQ